jgi:hypothetical protein
MEIKNEGGRVVSDFIESITARADAIRVMVMTRDFQLEGDIHCPRQGRAGRRLSNMLNNKDRNFLALTDVQIVNRVNGGRDPKVYPLIQVNLESIEYICPYLDAAEIEGESREPDQEATS